MALCAPRPVLFTNGREDTWINPAGQFEVLRAAAPVYRLLGAGDFSATELPPDGQLIDGTLGYFLRPGGHSLKPEDWKAFLDFADKQLGPPAKPRSASALAEPRSAAAEQANESTAAPVEVPRWEMHEFELHGRCRVENPFRDAALVGEFTAPSGKTIDVEGFYDGDDTWRLRFAPDEEGEWRYRLRGEGRGDSPGRASALRRAARARLHPHSSGEPLCLCPRRRHGVLSDGRHVLRAVRRQPHHAGPATRVSGDAPPPAVQLRPHERRPQRGAGGGGPGVLGLGRHAGQARPRPLESGLLPRARRAVSRPAGARDERRVAPAELLPPAVHGHQALDAGARAALAALRRGPLCGVRQRLSLDARQRIRNPSRWPLSPGPSRRRGLGQGHRATRQATRSRIATRSRCIRSSRRARAAQVPRDPFDAPWRIGEFFGEGDDLDVLSQQTGQSGEGVAWDDKLQCWVGDAPDVVASLRADRRFRKPVLNTESGYEYLRGHPTEKKQVHHTDKVRRTAWRIVCAGGYFAAGFHGTIGHSDAWNRIDAPNRYTFTVRDEGAAASWARSTTSSPRCPSGGCSPLTA